MKFLFSRTYTVESLRTAIVREAMRDRRSYTPRQRNLNVALTAGYEQFRRGA